MGICHASATAQCRGWRSQHRHQLGVCCQACQDESEASAAFQAKELLCACSNMVICATGAKGGLLQPLAPYNVDYQASIA